MKLTTRSTLQANPQTRFVVFSRKSLIALKWRRFARSVPHYTRCSTLERVYTIVTALYADCQVS
jgi:hypothetical protein